MYIKQDGANKKKRPTINKLDLPFSCHSEYADRGDSCRGQCAL